MIAREGETIVFVEVKTRASDEFGTPDQAVDQEKRAHLLRAASAYLRAADAGWDRARFDIVSVTLDPNASGTRAEIRHMKDAFGRPPI
jgi:putative endonuclease